MHLIDEALHSKLVSAANKMLEDDRSLESLRSVFANNDSNLEVLRISAEIKTRLFCNFSL